MVLFWKSWPYDYRYVGYTIAFLFVSALVFLAYSYSQGNDAIIHWEKFQDQKVIESALHEFQLGPFTLSIPAENFVVSEYFNGSMITPNVNASYVYLFLLMVSAVMVVTIITTFDRFWFITGIVLFILFIYTLKLPVLLLFGNNDHWSTIIFSILIGSAGAYFNILRNQTTFLTRLAFFSFLFIGVSLVIYFFSGVPIPFLHLAVTSYMGALVITLLFILLIAHEIPAALVLLISKNSTGSKSLQHFMIISVIYLVNLILTGLHQIGVIDWNFIYINIYLLFIISGVVGFWGFRSRESLYENILPFHPFGAFLYLALGTIAFATLGNFLGNMNDSALRILCDIIIFTHIGYCFIFMLYVVSNFIELLGNNLAVDKVLYKPTRMPYVSFQLAGLIVSLAFAFYVGWREYVYNGVAGFYTQLGDLDLELANDTFARAHFEQARSYGFQNHHANYVIAQMKSRDFNFDDAHIYYRRANGKNPSEYSLVNNGNIFIWENEMFLAIKDYRNSLNTFPNSGHLENNLGYSYGKIYNLDSATYFLGKAREHDYTRQSAEANFFALEALETMPIYADSIVQTFDHSYPATVANALALANSQNQKFDFAIDPLKYKTLNLYTATLLNNYIVRHAKTMDSTEVKAIYIIANDSLNSDYGETLKVALASAYYFQHNISRALEIMAELTYMSQSYAGQYNYLQGLWALEQDNPEIAATYFGFSVTQNYKKANLYRAIALTEAGLLAEAKVAWDSLAANGDDDEKQLSHAINNIITLPYRNAASLEDPLKYQFCRYRISVYDTSEFEMLAPTFSNDNYKAQAIYDMAQRQFAWGNFSKSILYINQVSGLAITNKNLYNSIRHLELLMLAQRREIRNLASQINNEIEFDLKYQLEKLLYTALISEESGDTTKAEQNYRILSAYNPYFEEGIIAAANFYRTHGKDQFEAYSILAEAIHINNNSPKLLMAYIEEANRVGFVEYAESATEQLREVINKKRRSTLR